MKQYEYSSTTQPPAIRYFILRKFGIVKQLVQNGETQSWLMVHETIMLLWLNFWWSIAQFWWKLSVLEKFLGWEIIGAYRRRFFLFGYINDYVTANWLKGSLNCFLLRIVSCVISRARYSHVLLVKTLMKASSRYIDQENSSVSYIFWKTGYNDQVNLSGMSTHFNWDIFKLPELSPPAKLCASHCVQRHNSIPDFFATNDVEGRLT